MIALMLEQIAFTIISFFLFVHILFKKMIRKNDITYLLMLLLQATGLLLNLLRISFNILNSNEITITLYILCIIIPILVVILESRNINASEILRIMIAQIWLWFGKEKKAKKILINLVNKYPNSFVGHKMLARIYEQEGGMRKAIDEYVKVLDIKKNDYNSYYKISVLLNELGKKTEATQMLETLLKNQPQTLEASNLLGKIYLEQNEYKKAVEVYNSATKYNPNNAKLYYELGICYSKINDFNIAKSCFQKAIETNKDMYLAYYRLGQIALLYRDFDEAETNFKNALYNEKEAKAYFELAKIHIMKSQKEEAIKDIENAIKIDSTYYAQMKSEPILFSIKNQISKPHDNNKSKYQETAEELEIEEYLNNTYNLTKQLNNTKK